MTAPPATPQTIPDGMWLTTIETCRLLECDRRTLAGLRTRGELFGRAHGNGERHRSYRYRKADVLRLAGLLPPEPAPATPVPANERERAADYHRLCARLYRQLALAADELAAALDGTAGVGDGAAGR